MGGRARGVGPADCGACGGHGAGGRRRRSQGKAGTGKMARVGKGGGARRRPEEGRVHFGEAGGRGLEKHLDEAVKDVRRALDALKRVGLLAGEVVRYPEYPVIMPDGQGRLITGYIDLVAWASDCVWIIDFKTDPPPEGPLELAYPDYVKQIGLYKELLGRTAGIKKTIRAGLLFSATGRRDS